MTSWSRGDKNEDKGERLMKKPGLADKAKGAMLKAVGEVEQGVEQYGLLGYARGVGGAPGVSSLLRRGQPLGAAARARRQPRACI